MPLAAAADMTGLPLLSAMDPQAPLAWRGGQPISRAQYLRDVRSLAASLPEGGPLFAMTADRYHFALAFGASLVRGQTNVLPPNHTADTVARLKTLFPQIYAVREALGLTPVVDLPTVAFPSFAGAAAAAHSAAAATAAATAAVGAAHSATDLADIAALPVPRFAADTVAAQVLTSGSTGAPMPHSKTWGALVENIGAEAQRLAEYLGRTDLHGVTLVGTVPAHHMYGFESTVLIALLGGAAFAAEKPFFPAEIVACLDAVPRPRMLVTTPFHLKTLLESGLDLPPVDLVVCATAPLSPQMAQRAEIALDAPLAEIYGCTEAGQVATRLTTRGAEWQTYRGLRLQGNGDQVQVDGGHVLQPTFLADALEVLSPTRFRLLGRANDLINVAGKRGSLSHLNFHLNSIEGVRDGAFWLPEPGEASEVEDVVRLVAFVITEGLSRERLLAQLRLRIDPVFLPRRIVEVEALPRDGTGKLPAGRLNTFARAALLRGRVLP